MIMIDIITKSRDLLYSVINFCHTFHTSYNLSFFFHVVAESAGDGEVVVKVEGEEAEEIEHLQEVGCLLICLH